MNIAPLHQPKYIQTFCWFMVLYALIAVVLYGTGDSSFEHLHLVADTSNAILSLLLVIFLLGEQHAIPSNVRNYLVIGFGLAAGTELLHALVGIEWYGNLEWIQFYSGLLRPATWPPSTYLLPLSLLWTLLLMRRGSNMRPDVYAVWMVLLTVVLFALSFKLPRYMDTGILGIQRPTQAPLLLLWVYVIALYWRERSSHMLYQGLAMMGVLLLLSDLCMLYSTSPHEKFAMMAHVGKLIAYIWMHLIQMHIALADSRGRNAAESALRANEASLRAILDNSPYLAWLKDNDGRYIKVNKAYADFARLEDARQAVGKTDLDLWPKDMAEKYRADDADVMATRQKKHVEERSQQGNNVIWVETYKTPVIDDSGTMLGTAGFAHDITARKHAEERDSRYIEELEALNLKLQDTQDMLLQSDKMASVGQLAAGVAHEINNPIGYVYSNLGTLERYVEDAFGMLDQYEQAEATITDPEVRDKLKAARDKLDIAYLKEDLDALVNESKDGIARVKKIVQNLKDFSHMDASDEWHFADLHGGLDSTLNIVNNEIKYKAEVIKEYGDLPEVECLLSQLNQVFMNLLVNAAHAIEERGTITIRTGRKGNEVWVNIADTGKGIAPEHMKKIFDPFFTTKPIGKGTGLGLSLSYGIVQKHHGRIEVSSPPGKGTSFIVWLPVKRQAADASA